MVRKMKIYTDGQHKIVAIDVETQAFVYFYELEESPFPKEWSMEKILTYHYLELNGEVKIYP
jgi:hypothetical protein